jgi:hypothetical protein
MNQILDILQTLILIAGFSSILYLQNEDIKSLKTEVSELKFQIEQIKNQN